MKAIHLNEGLSGLIQSIPSHQCAYCGSTRTVLQNMMHNYGLVKFSIFCNTCGNVDVPSLPAEDLKKILMTIG